MIKTFGRVGAAAAAVDRAASVGSATAPSPIRRRSVRRSTAPGYADPPPETTVLFALGQPRRSKDRLPQLPGDRWRGEGEHRHGAPADERRRDVVADHP